MDENDECYGEDDLDPDEEIECAVHACGQTDVPGFCWHAGTEYCMFQCRFRPSLNRNGEDNG